MLSLFILGAKTLSNRRCRCCQTSDNSFNEQMISKQRFFPIVDVINYSSVIPSTQKLRKWWNRRLMSTLLNSLMFYAEKHFALHMCVWNNCSAMLLSLFHERLRIWRKFYTLDSSSWIPSCKCRNNEFFSSDEAWGLRKNLPRTLLRIQVTLPFVFPH